MTTEAQIAHYEFEIPIQASPEAAWKALTESIDRWWMGDFRILGSESKVSLDPTPGGLLVEEGPDGGALVWYSVQMVTPGRSLHLVGHTAPRWGGPTTSMLELRIEEGPEGARLLVRDGLIGAVDEKQVRSLEGGWKQLFGEGFATWAGQAAQA